MKKELNDIGVSHANLKSSHLPRLSFGETDSGTDLICLPTTLKKGAKKLIINSLTASLVWMDNKEAVFLSES